jgi:hypothetical protein
MKEDGRGGRKSGYRLCRARSHAAVIVMQTFYERVKRQAVVRRPV